MRKLKINKKIILVLIITIVITSGIIVQTVSTNNKINMK